MISPYATSVITAQHVNEIHDFILHTENGLAGSHGAGPLEGALARIHMKIEYEGLDDVYEIGAMYAVALARGHVFNDANKRTALVTCLSYLAMQGIDIPRNAELEDVMVEVAEGKLDEKQFADVLYSMYHD